MIKSRLRNKYLKWLSREKFLADKKVKNKCNTLTRNTKRKTFDNIAKNEDYTTSKKFQNAVRLIITNKGKISDEKMKIKTVENKKIKISKLKIKTKIN